MEYRPSRHTKIFDVLFKLAETVEPVGNAKLAAAIVIKNEIISFGINKRKSHPFQKRFGKNSDAIFLHAEIDAIKNALRHVSQEELSRASLYVARAKKTEKRNYIQGMAKPCEKGCQCAIAAFGIKNVYYTTDMEGVYKCL
jgi:deoxycytidylate deaminase